MTRKGVARPATHSAAGLKPNGERQGVVSDAELEASLKAHGDQLLKYVTRLLPADVRKCHDPLDVVQDVFLQAFCSAEDFPVSDRGAALRWLKFLRVLEQALGQLQPDHATAIRLRYVQGLSCKEAGAQMRCTDRAVEALCRRGLEALRLELPSGTVFF